MQESCSLCIDNTYRETFNWNKILRPAHTQRVHVQCFDNNFFPVIYRPRKKERFFLNDTADIKKKERPGIWIKMPAALLKDI